MDMEQLFLIGVIALLCLLAAFRSRIFRKKGPGKTARAEVLSRRGNMPDGSYSNFRGSRMQYYVTFSAEGETLELTVTPSEYTRLLEGTRGMLTWQDQTLVFFQPEDT